MYKLRRFFSTFSATRLVVLSAWSSRAISVAASFATIGILLDGLGENQYSAFVVLSGLAGWYALADFGIGYTLQNEIAGRIATNQSYARSVVAACYLLLVTAVLLILALAVGSNLMGSWLLGKISAIEKYQSGTVFLVSSSLFVLAAVGSVAHKILYARQRGYWANVLIAVSSVVGLGAAWLAVHYTTNKLMFSIVGLFGPGAFLSLLFLAGYYRLAASERPRLVVGDFTWLVRKAAGFTSFGVLAAFVLQVDYIIISQTLSPADIVVYGTATKIFGVVAFFYNSVLYAWWPSITAAFAQNDVTRIRKELHVVVGKGALYTISAVIALVIGLPYVLPMLSRHYEIAIPVHFIVLLGAYNLIRTYVDANAIALQSIGALRPLTIFAFAQALVSGGLQWWLSSRFGIDGIVYGLIASFFATVLWGLPLSLNRIIRNRAALGVRVGGEVLGTR